jgi:iron complex outermembrane receptor protein
MKKLVLFFISIVGLNLYSQNLDKDTIKLKQIEVVVNLPYQATKDVPITFKNLTQKDLSIVNYGQEPSQILNNTPSITSYSDAGSSWGYSYIRLRGIDQTRINMTLNGAPLNEPEDQGCYFSNYPDFLQSIKVMQIQRGIGMSKNGIANFAGSLNFESLDPQRGLDFSTGFGSFNSKKYSVGLGTKNLYARFSSINSDGFRDHSGNKSKSFFLASEGKYKKHTLKMIAFVGNQKNELAWLGSTKEQLELNPKYNSCTDNEHDNFTQMRLQLHHNYEINQRSSLNSAIYYNYLEGSYTYQYYYDSISNTYPHTSDNTFGSIDKYNLKSNTLGFYTNYIYHNKNLNIYSGINGQIYSRKHNGQTWNDVNFYIHAPIPFLPFKNYDYEYFNTGYRNEMSAFVKMTYNILGFNIFQDYQYRFNTFRYSGDVKMDNFNWNFFNPTIGIEKNIGKTTLYYSIGKTHREPTRNDIFMGMDNLYDESLYIKMKPESVIDNELGVRYLNNKFAINVNLYYMKFTDEITLTGYFGPTGLLLHSNVDNSFRSGIEVDMKWKIGNFILANNSSVSNNKVKVEDKEFNPVLTPNMIINQDVSYKFGRFLLGVNGRYQGESYIDLANQYKLDDFFCLNGNFKVLLGRLIEIDLFVNNITNKKFYTNGLISMDGTPLYFRQSGINYFLNFKLKI